MKSINHITFAVRNLDISFRFYRDMLGLKPVAKWKTGAYFLAGETWLALNLDEKVTWNGQAKIDTFLSGHF